MACWRAQCCMQRGDRQRLWSPTFTKWNTWHALERDKRANIFLTLCGNSLTSVCACVCVHVFMPPVFLDYADLCVLALFTVEWPVMGMSEDLNIQPHSVFTAATYTRVKCVICEVVSATSRCLMTGPHPALRARQCPVTDNKMHLVHVRWEINASYISSISAAQEAISFLRWRLVCQYQTPSPPTCRRTCQSHLSIRTTLLISPVAPYLP